ncbi:hypothetical protein, partial [Pantoea dispersa]
ILRHGGLIHEVIEGKIKGTVGRGRRRIQHLDDMKDGRGYNRLKEEAGDREHWRQKFSVQRHGPATRQNTA